MTLSIKIALAVVLLLCGLLLGVSMIQSHHEAREIEAHQEILEPNIVVNNVLQDVEKVKSGDTASVMLKRLGFSASEAANIIKAARPVYPLRSIHIGHEFIRQTQPDVKVSYAIDASRKLQLELAETGEWKAEVLARNINARTAVVGAIITDNLFLDAAKAGLSDRLTIKIVDMFSWDIDFARDLRQGDSFKVLYEESFDDVGKRVDYTILGATFINKGITYSGIRFENKKGEVEYFNEEGRNLRKTYLKSPVKFSRISSRFSASRKHPVLGYTRAHRGVDYAAKSGTPVHAIGDGKIVYKGLKGGYGRFIEIRHANGIHSTAYAHLSRYASGIRKGDTVRQGQVIGYVGMSGLATGPHLHFEFRSRGRAVNPLTIKHDPAKPVAEEELSAFRLKAKEVLQKITIFDQPKGWG